MLKDVDCVGTLRDTEGMPFKVKFTGFWNQFFLWNSSVLPVNSTFDTVCAFESEFEITTGPFVCVF